MATRAGTIAAVTTPSTTWAEKIAPDEDARFERIAATFRALQEKNARGGARMRALHAKPNLGVEAELEVLANLEPHLRQGLFAEPRAYRAYVRFSNGQGVKQADPKPDVRGVALKVVGAPGKKVIPGMEDARTQDFLLIKAREFPFRTPDEFAALVWAGRDPALAPLRVFGALGFGRGLELLRKLIAGIKEPPHSLATTQYFQPLPVRFGAYAARVALTPHAKAEGAPSKKTAEYLAADLAATLRQGPVKYDLQVQLYVDEANTPIEDPTVDWSDADSPWATVARLTLPKQDAESPRGKKLAAYVESLSFDPWHAMVEHRPLGAVMRARNRVYRESTSQRGVAKEPDGSERIE
jgi:hypothetical protein